MDSSSLAYEVKFPVEEPTCPIAVCTQINSNARKLEQQILAIFNTIKRNPDDKYELFGHLISMTRSDQHFNGVEVEDFGIVTISDGKFYSSTLDKRVYEFQLEHKTVLNKILTINFPNKQLYEEFMEVLEEFLREENTSNE